MREHVTIFEVGPRDGLQNETTIIPVEKKVALVNLLSDVGFKKIEVSSFVSPKWVPQMADAAEVFSGIKRHAHVQYSALVPNLRGCDTAIDAKADEVAVFTSASDIFSQRNINCSVVESLERFMPVIAHANQYGLPVRGYISCVTHCPYNNTVAPTDVAAVVASLLEMGVYEVSLADTIGHGTPTTVNAMLDAVLDVAPASVLAGHFHDTGGRAIDNIRACLHRDIRVFDSATGGLGGCPYAPGAPGNVSSLELAEMLHAEGLETGLDLDRLKVVSEQAMLLKS